MSEPLCPAWLSFTLTNVFRRLAHDPVRILGPFVREGNVALDIGCGPGFFTVPLARLAGDRGRVYAVDLQAAMLARTERRAARAGVLDRVRTVLADRASLRLPERADLALVFWVAHEVADPGRFFAEIRSALEPRGRLLLVEPRVHVSAPRYDEIVATAVQAGFEPGETPPVRISRAVVLRAGPISRNRPAGGTAS